MGDEARRIAESLRTCGRSGGVTMEGLRRTLRSIPLPPLSWALAESASIQQAKARIAAIACTDVSEVDELLAVARDRMGRPVGQILDVMRDSALRYGSLAEFRAVVSYPLPVARAILQRST
jgi:hypothetical protein